MRRAAGAPYFWRRAIELAAAAPRFDVVVLQRVLLPKPLLIALRRRARVLVLNVDDAIYTTHEGAAPTPHAAERFDATIKCCDGVMVSSAALMARVRECQPRVVTIPSAVDCERYRPCQQQQAPTIVGWIGSPSTSIYLPPLLPLLRQLTRTVPDLAVELVGASGMSDEDKIRVVPWSLGGEPDLLARFDIGIMPLVDDEWARAKAGYKLLLYMACGIPSVASPVGANRDIVKHGETGLLADKPEQWETALRMLIDDRALRSAMGGRARVLAENKFSVARWAPDLCATLRRFADHGSAAHPHP